MNSTRLFIQSRYPLAVIAGLLLATAFPKIGVAGCAWIAPGLMVVIALGQSGKQCFRLGYVAGLAHYLTSLYWLLLIPYRWHGIPFGPAAGWLALSAVLSLFPATWLWLVAKVLIWNPQPAATDATGNRTLSDLISSSNWSRRTLWMLAAAAIWVTFEMTLARLLTGFPWNLLGTSQVKILPLIQIASFTGVYGVSFIIVWFSLSLLCAILVVIRRPTMRSAWLGEIIFPLVTIAVIYGFGYRKLMQPVPAGRTVKLALVQPSIPQNLIWDANENANRFQKLLQLSAVAMTNHPDILLWPEAAVPNLLRWHEPTYRAITGFARSNKVWMIIGADDAEPRRNSPKPNDADYYNSSFLISPDGQAVKSYRKRRLVIFGEYIPLVRWLPFLKYVTPIDGGFTPGDGPVPFETTHPKVKTAVLICFEDNFPQLVRDSVDDDTDLLVNLTNNGWFGEGAAQWQHAANAILRTVENGLPLVRCTNNGLTCWIDAQGRLRDVFGLARGDVYGSGFITIQVPLLPEGRKRPPTFYHQHGDWFGWSCVFATILLVITRSRSSRKPPEPTK